MDELELLRHFRSEALAPDETTVARVRAALLDRVAVEESQSADWDDHRLPQVRRARRWPAPLTATVVVAAAVAVVLTTLPPNGAHRAAAAELSRLAAVAVEQPFSGLGPGEYYYLREEGHDPQVRVAENQDGYTALFHLTREYWVAADGSGRLVTIPGEVIWPSSRDRERWEADGSTPFDGPSDLTYGPGELVADESDARSLATLPEGYDFDTLPHDPEALHEVISQAAAEREAKATRTSSQAPTPILTFTVCVELLHTPLTPPDSRASLFKAMGYIPGITVVAEKTIPEMGTGTAVFIEAKWGEVRVRQEFLVDPETSLLLGYRETQLDRAWWVDAAPPFVATAMRYSTPRIVESVTERPKDVAIS